jgi:hypothetical protein
VVSLNSLRNAEQEAARISVHTEPTGAAAFVMRLPVSVLQDSTNTRHHGPARAFPARIGS